MKTLLLLFVRLLFTMSVPYIHLNNKKSMPALGLGTWLSEPGK
jgi:hypothetical protein